MLLHFQLINMQTGETDIPGYIEADAILSWNVWKLGDDLSQGMHRTMRGKTIVVINVNNGIGLAHMTTDSFDSVSARILEARGQKDRAEIHAAAHASAKINKSSLAVS
jgi:hypothetical protein